MPESSGWKHRRRSRLAPALLGGLLAFAAAVTPSVAAADSRPSAEHVAESSGPAAEAKRLVAEMTTIEHAASIVMGHIPTTDPTALSGYMQNAGIGGFILMGANIPGSEPELRAVTAALHADPVAPPLIAIDQEGGDVSRLPWDTFPAARTLKELPVADTTAGFGARVTGVQGRSERQLRDRRRHHRRCVVVHLRTFTRLGTGLGRRQSRSRRDRGGTARRLDPEALPRPRRSSRRLARTHPEHGPDTRRVEDRRRPAVRRRDRRRRVGPDVRPPRVHGGRPAAGITVTPLASDRSRRPGIRRSHRHGRSRDAAVHRHR